MYRQVKQSSSWPRAGAEYQRTRPEPAGRGGTGSSRASSRGPAIRPAPKTRRPPGKTPAGGTPALGGATPVRREPPGSHSGTAGRRPVSFQAHSLRKDKKKKASNVLQCKYLCSKDSLRPL